MSEDRPGKRLAGKYELVAKMGEGGMAVVWRGLNHGSEGFAMPVAIKRVHPGFRGHYEVRQLFIEEARVGAGLRHPTIVQVHDFGADEQGDLFLVTELVRGRDDEGKGLSDEEILDNLRLLVLAGHETTASVMAWMASFMATNPAVQERVIAEATATEGLPQTPADMGRFPYAEALFRESLPSLFAAFSNQKILSGLKQVDRLVMEEKYYEALKTIRGLYPTEEEILNDRSFEQPSFRAAIAG